MSTSVDQSQTRLFSMKSTLLKIIDPVNKTQTASTLIKVLQAFTVLNEPQGSCGVKKSTFPFQMSQSPCYDRVSLWKSLFFSSLADCFLLNLKGLFFTSEPHGSCGEKKSTFKTIQPQSEDCWRRRHLTLTDCHNNSLGDHSTKFRKTPLGRVLMSKQPKMLHFSHLKCLRLIQE